MPNKSLRFVVAMDSFKGCLSSTSAGEAVASGIRDCFPEAVVTVLPMADGGEGTAQAITQASGGTTVSAPTVDPLGHPITAHYGISPDGATAYIDMAAASGLTLLHPSERNPLLTGTFGTGLLMTDALSRGCCNIMLGLGGSSTHDGAIGCLAALGLDFFDSCGRIIERPCGKDLALIRKAAVTPRLADFKKRCSRLYLACDVNVPLCGHGGAAYIFAPQKGASPEVVARLDAGMESFSDLTLRATGHDMRNFTGAAGGLGAGLCAWLDGKIEDGVALVLSAVGFGKCVNGAALAVTGEGRSDPQTLLGKVPAGVYREAAAKGVPSIIISGQVEEPQQFLDFGFKAAIASSPAGLPLSEAMKPETAKANLRRAAREIVKKLSFK